MARSAEPYLFIIRNGPIWDLEGQRFIARAFGSRFRGEICTYGNEPGFLSENGIEMRRFVFKAPRRALARALYTTRIVGRAMRKRWLDGERLVIVSYDPLQSGVMGVLAKWLTGAPLICEVNGVYGEDENLVDMPDREARAAKRNRMLRVGTFVLRRADHVKLLFPEQLDGFGTSICDQRVWFFNLINEDVFQPRGLTPEKRMVFVGYPFLRKGADHLLEAWDRLRGEFPDWSLTLVGFRVEEDAREGQHPTEGVEFFGPLPPEELAALIESSAGLVLPSRSEAMGRVLLESAHLGRPRLGSRVGGIPYYIEHGVDGLLFEPANTDSLEQALRRFMSDPGLREKLSRGARERARTSFSSQEYLRRYGEIVKRLTNWEGPPAELSSPQSS
ncbi:MAG: glycosyltransferase [Longimicrobiales bacterium]